MTPPNVGEQVQSIDQLLMLPPQEVYVKAYDQTVSLSVLLAQPIKRLIVLLAGGIYLLTKTEQRA